MNRNLEKLNVFSMVRDLVRQIWVIAMAFIGVKLIVWSVITLTFVPQYTSSATVAVSTSSVSSVYSDLATTESMAEILSEVLDSDLMMDVVKEDLGRDDLNLTFSTSLVPETNLLTLSVTAEDARTAYEAMTSVMTNYDSVIGNVVSGAVFRVIQQPAVAFSAVNSPDRSRPSTLAGLVAALFVAWIVCFFSLNRPTIKNSGMVSSQLNAHLLGSLPHEELNKSLKAKMKKLNKGLLTTNATVSFAFTERTRQLCTRVDSTARRHGCQAIMITSFLENEGKSTVAANLALGLASQGRKVLLVDADLRKPAIYKLLSRNPDNHCGLNLWLDGSTNKLSSLVSWDKNHKMWICCGKKHCGNAAELLGGERMALALDAWRREFDYIILDVPPMSVTSDSEIIAASADASILVVREDRAAFEPLNESVNYLERNHARFLGVIYNDEHKMELTAIGTYGSHYGYGYGYGGYSYAKSEESSGAGSGSSRSSGSTGSSRSSGSAGSSYGAGNTAGASTGASGSSYGAGSAAGSTGSSYNAGGSAGSAAGTYGTGAAADASGSSYGAAGSGSEYAGSASYGSSESSVSTGSSGSGSSSRSSGSGSSSGSSGSGSSSRSSGSGKSSGSGHHHHHHHHSGSGRS